METITLKTPSMEGKIYIGEDAITSRLPALTKEQECFVITDSNVFSIYGEWLKTKFPDSEIYVLPAGEENKTFPSLYDILSKMVSTGLRRTARVFAVGGGVVGDIGGLAAALYMRGISCVQIPTTLLSQVDSSVGGKTAVDLGGVKNVVGAFYQPCEVLVDPTFLKTLPLREIKCGLGEIVKYAALNGEIFDLLEKNPDKFGDLQFLRDLTVACVRHKARVVEADEKESGERRSLNVGHTTGHAIELTSGLSHGESVLYGMYLETKMAMRAGVCDQAYGERLLQIILTALRVAPIEKLDFSGLEKDAEKARSDKKNTGDGKIKMAVAKKKNEWTMFALTFKEYKQQLLAAANGFCL